MPSRTILVVAESFGARSNATLTAAAIGHGLRAGERPLMTDLCPLEEPSPGGSEPAELRASLAALDLDKRLRRARAVVIAAARLDHHTLLEGGAVFEIATRARQSGVPACAIAGQAGLDLFEARILDLQIVLKARGARALAAAAETLATMLDPVQ